MQWVNFFATYNLSILDFKCNSNDTSTVKLKAYNLSILDFKYIQEALCELYETLIIYPYWILNNIISVAVTALKCLIIYPYWILNVHSLSE